MAVADQGQRRVNRAEIEIDPAGDEDRFVLEVSPGKKYRITVLAADLDSALDGLDAETAARQDSRGPEIVQNQYYLTENE